MILFTTNIFKKFGIFNQSRDDSREIKKITETSWGSAHYNKAQQNN